MPQLLTTSPVNITPVFSPILHYFDNLLAAVSQPASGLPSITSLDLNRMDDEGGWVHKCAMDLDKELTIVVNENVTTGYRWILNQKVEQSGNSDKLELVYNSEFD